MDLKKAEDYLNKELGFVKNTLISYPEVIKAMAKYAESEAINYSQCCKSDSEQLVLFADWLQYNGKWSTTEQQVKDFLKEQEEQN